MSVLDDVWPACSSDPSCGGIPAGPVRGRGHGSRSGRGRGRPVLAELVWRQAGLKGTTSGLATKSHSGRQLQPVPAQEREPNDKATIAFVSAKLP
jgi:hypothetical protein